MSALTPLAKQHDAVYNLLDDDGTEQPIEAPKTSGQKHADRALRPHDTSPRQALNLPRQ